MYAADCLRKQLTDFNSQLDVFYDNTNDNRAPPSSEIQ